ncbi:MAG: hypothetical protein ACR2NM_01160, partial [Bythopirellula sp.]
TSSLSGDLAAGQLVTIRADVATNTTVTAAAGFTNASTLTIDSTATTSSRLLMGGTTLVNEAPGELAFSGPGTGVRELRGRLDNRGRTTVDVDATIGDTGLSHLNSGEMHVDALATLVGSSLTNEPTGIVSGTGSLDVQNIAFTNAGIIAPGESTGVLSVVGNVPFDSTANLAIELASESDHDQLAVTDSVALAGTLDVSLIGGYAPVAGASHTILTAGSITGQFNAINGSPGGGFGYVVQYFPMHVDLIVITGLPGDYNNDGSVDAADYVVWRDLLGAVAGTLPNDIDGGSIGSLQYTTWKAHYGQMTPSSLEVDMDSVPECSTVTLLLIGLFAGGVMRSKAAPWRRLLP